MKIPKIIHYCWFGGNKKPADIEKCIESWKRYLPDWKIIEWTEDNYDVHKYQYTSDAYRLKKWAFVSDMARLDILYQYGGVYLDVDVEFIKDLPENYLNYDGFCGFEHTATIAPGLIFGIKKEHPFLKEVLDSYSNEHFELHSDGIYITINTRITEMLLQRGLKKNNKFQIVDGIAVFPSEYFCGYDTDVREPNITEKTICWHHYLGSWSQPTIKMKCQNVLKKAIGVKNYRSVLNIIRMIRKGQRCKL